jgi:hypothetical protein
MKHIILLIALFFISTIGSAQSISGVVQDNESNPVAFADIVLRQTQDSSVAKIGYTEEDGSFVVLPPHNGEYFLQISYVGQKPYSSAPFQFDGSDVELGTLSMESATTLDEVTVTAKKPLVEVLPDKTRFNVEGSINAQGSDAFELLRRAPGVVVDNNDNISLMGKNGVRVYINGRPSPLGGDDLAAFLRSLNSDDIASIDIITNPSARYEAEGNAGIIDIRLKKNQKHGTNATVNLGAAQGITPKGNGSVTGNYRNDELNVFASTSYRQGINRNWADFEREQVGQFFDAENDIKRDAWSSMSRAGLDYTVAPGHTLGMQASELHAEPTNSTNTVTRISDLETGDLERWLISANNETNIQTNLDFNLNYRWQVSEGSNFSIDLDYGRFDRESDQLQPNTYYEADRTTVIEQNDYHAITPIGIDIYSFKADYDLPLWGGKLSTGVKSRRVVTDNQYAFYELMPVGEILDFSRSNDFLYDEWVNAGYFQYQTQKGKWGYQLGLRAEYTISEGELKDLEGNMLKNTPRDYLDFFPSAGVSYAPSRSHSWNFNYSRRIDRPNYQDLNPFEFKLSELSFRQGNAFLNPQYTHSVKLSHTYNYKLTTSLSYSYIDDFFAQLIDTIDTEASFIMTDNLATQQVINMNVSYPFSLNQNWNWYINLNGGYSMNRADYGEGKEVDLNVPFFNVYGQTSYLLGSGFTAEVSGWWNAGGVWGGIFESAPMGGIDAGLQYAFPNERGNVKLSLTDVFFTRQWGGKSDFGAQSVEAMGGWESRQVRLNFNYTFGNQKVKKARERKTGIDEEKQRMNGGGNGPG